jgi:hypothetical protein
MLWKWLLQIGVCLAYLAAVYGMSPQADKFQGQVLSVSPRELVLQVEMRRIVFRPASEALVTLDGRSVSLVTLRPHDEAVVWAERRDGTWLVRQVNAHTGPVDRSFVSLSDSRLESAAQTY